MALTVTPIKAYSVGDRKEVVVDITFDSSYPTGGESLTLTDLGLTELTHFPDAAAWNGTLAVLTHYDVTNSKLLAFKSNTAASFQEVADTNSLASYVVRVRVVGKGPVSA